MSAVPVALLLAGVLAAGCTAAQRPTPPGSEGRRAAPWPQRPVVELRFEVAADLATVSGRETVRFTPDLRICSLVFRAWPNKPQTARSGNALTVTAAVVDGRAVRPRVAAAGSPPGAPGTLVEVPLASCVPAGRSVTADLRFRLTLGEEVDERVGFSRRYDLAWFATAFPLLAWERERGWAREEAADLPGEMATSEDFRLASLEVTAPSRYRVLGTGARAGSRPGAARGTTVHRFHAEAVRDVAVSVGRLEVVEHDVDRVRLHLGGPQSGTDVPLGEWTEHLATSIRRLSALLGPFPYPDLWMTIVPDESEGIEFPGAIQVGDLDPGRSSALIAHELAHMWFYGLVGNNQGRDPWLDESFATFAQAALTGREADYSLADVPPGLAGRTGESMTFWAGRGARAYDRGVYLQGAAALLEARQRVGAERFDWALRAYLDTNAYQIATPADVERAFAGLPRVVGLLRQVGALTGR